MGDGQETLEFPHHNAWEGSEPAPHQNSNASAVSYFGEVYIPDQLLQRGPVGMKFIGENGFFIKNICDSTGALEVEFLGTNPYFQAVDSWSHDGEDGLLRVRFKTPTFEARSTCFSLILERLEGLGIAVGFHVQWYFPRTLINNVQEPSRNPRAAPGTTSASHCPQNQELTYRAPFPAACHPQQPVGQQAPSYYPPYVPVHQSQQLAAESFPSHLAHHNLCPPIPQHSFPSHQEWPNGFSSTPMANGHMRYPSPMTQCSSLRPALLERPEHVPAPPPVPPQAQQHLLGMTHGFPFQPRPLAGPEHFIPPQPVSAPFCHPLALTQNPSFPPPPQNRPEHFASSPATAAQFPHPHHMTGYCPCPLPRYTYPLNGPSVPPVPGNSLAPAAGCLYKGKRKEQTFASSRMFPPEKTKPARSGKASESRRRPCIPAAYGGGNAPPKEDDETTMAKLTRVALDIAQHWKSLADATPLLVDPADENASSARLPPKPTPKQAMKQLKTAARIVSRASNLQRLIQNKLPEFKDAADAAKNIEGMSKDVQRKVSRFNVAEAARLKEEKGKGSVEKDGGVGDKSKGDSVVLNEPSK